MSDQVLVTPEGDVPVNPYSLLDAVNKTSEDARTGWLIFLGLMAYLLIAVAGIGHKELLLAKDVQLPITSVTVNLQQFFLFAPIALCFLHFGLLAHHAMLARKVLEFDLAVRPLETSNQPRHPLRLELHSYFFTQALAGPQRALLMRFFLHTQAWLTLVALPVLLLLYVQVSFLPFHDQQVTWAHRYTVLLDILMLGLMGVFLYRIDTSFLGAAGRSLRHHPVMFVLTTVLLVAAGLFSMFAATYPGEAMARSAPQVPQLLRERIQRAIPFASTGPHDSVFGFRRTITVIDTDLTPTKDDARLVFRNRDLTFARLDRSILRNADFTGADLTGASLSGAMLEGALVSCPDASDLGVTNNRRRAGCAVLRNASLKSVKASRADFSGADLDGVSFVSAQLDDANFTNASARGTNFSYAHLERTEFALGVSLVGANFNLAQMQGADLRGAVLVGADLSNAGLQGAILATASLQGANLRGAELDGVNLQHTRLGGTWFGGAKIFGADFREAVVWMAQPPAVALSELADFTKLDVVAPDELELKILADVVAGIEDVSVRARVDEAVKPLTDKTRSQRWAAGPEFSQWKSLQQALMRSDGGSYRDELTGFLGNMSCRATWSNASVATGVVKRALDSSFRGNGEAIYARLHRPECSAQADLSKKLLRMFSAAIDNAKGVQTAGSAALSSIPQPTGTVPSPSPASLPERPLLPAGGTGGRN